MLQQRRAEQGIMLISHDKDFVTATTSQTNRCHLPFTARMLASMNLLFDPLFQVPLAVGLLASLLLPLLGCLLHAREEWLAALGIAHITAAGAIIRGNC